MHRWCGLSANLRCKSEKCCAEIQNVKSRQKIAIWAPSRNLSGYIFPTKARIDNRKNLLSSNISSTCPHNMENLGSLAAEIGPVVWGTPAYFNGTYRQSEKNLSSRLGSVTARHSSIGRQPIFAALNRGRHLYSAGRPSRWALAHILVSNHITCVQRKRQ